MAISDETRKLAEDTFAYIERSVASGNSYEANLPISGECIVVTPHPDVRAAILRAAGLDDLADDEELVPVTLADHTDQAIAKILGAGHPSDCPCGKHYVCLICCIHAPVSDGQPADAGPWPRWRCKDATACQARAATILGDLEDRA